MALQPSDENVDLFLALSEASMSRSEVIARLKGNNNNVEQALGEYFDAVPGESNKYRWDEGQFNSDRDGGISINGHQNIPSFDIQGPDDPGPYGRFDGAMSRPPSRTSNNKSPHGKTIDLSAQHAAADPRTSMTAMPPLNIDEGDRELEQALAASRAEAGLPPQESGITGTDKPYFGPANRSEYEPGKWEMVPMGKTSAQEILPDPEPADRKRDLNVPAFLKPSVDNHRLGAFLTIYHEIPLIREVFLDRIDVLPSYGHDKEWWTGKSIELPTIHTADEYEESEVVWEIQRLMAFLDKTDRSYGSAEALANLRDVKQAVPYQDVEAAVLNAWRHVFRDQPVIKKVFSKGVAKESREDIDVTEFAILDLSLPPKDSTQETLYDLADEAMWPNLEPSEVSESPYLSHVSDVIAFRVQEDKSRKDIEYKDLSEVPAVWYPDRYLKSEQQAALEMRLAKMDVQEKFRQISRKEDKLSMHQMPGGKIVKVSDMLNAALKHDEAEIKEDGQRDVTDVDMLSAQRPRKAANLSAQLRKIVASIDKKLIALYEEKERLRETMRKLSKLYTQPSEDPKSPALHKYTLRGVSTTKSTMYICRRAEPDLIDMDLDGNGPKVEGDQWWRIHYAASGSSPVTVEKTTEEKVLEAAKNESKHTILVYASEKAMNWPAKALPTPLENFVRWDNTLFKNEFPDDDSQTQLSSPGKRKFDERSVESQNSSPKGRDAVNVVERELRSSDESGSGSGAGLDDAKAASQNLASHVDGNNEEEVIVGIDPSMLSNDYQPPPTPPRQPQEMQERSGMPMLTGMQTNGGGGKKSTIDSMDLDQVLEDADTAAESAAVNNLGV